MSTELFAKCAYIATRTMLCTSNWVPFLLYKGYQLTKLCTQVDTLTSHEGQHLEAHIRERTKQRHSQELHDIAVAKLIDDIQDLLVERSLCTKKFTA
jgi:hypothetical protein